ncbi:helix-turn-helix transcriptional regulator [Microvenator marinus]|uniref:Helix-turn-helix transcriptional regulator n=1 Tax=Microvenator marinus TaxID=2600177 RepID=A0A5B8XY20_9DELT|nr:helix-turn-helix transcriptional regulator [Microvenator marinus]QED28319.1 helix-turn-helix transcriptional regulator [Microvenator marinus]
MDIEERDAFYDEVVEKVNSGEWTWGEAIRRLRVDVAKVNQAKFSRMTKVSVRTLRKLEHDEANPTMETLTSIFKIFGLQLGLKRKSS